MSAKNGNGNGNGNGNNGTRPQMELEPPQREAAYFYGLFLRGHSLDELRRDIAVPDRVQSRWQRLWRHEPHVRRSFEEILHYRRQVLAIFNTLVALEVTLSHLRQ